MGLPICPREGKRGWIEKPVRALQHFSSIKPRWQWTLFLIAGLVILFLPLPFPTGAPEERVIRVEASMYGFSPSEIAVNPGDRVTVELVAADVVHGFSLDGYDFSLTAEPGQTGSKSFVADKPGAFRFRCSVPCGNLHPFIVGKLTVGQNGLFFRALGLGALALVAALWTLKNSAWKRMGSTQAMMESEQA